jgi:hypothetical protein
MKKTNGKLWRTTGYRLLSGRIHGAGRHRIDTKMPSPLILNLINQAFPRVEPNVQYLSNPLNSVEPITMR